MKITLLTYIIILFSIIYYFIQSYNSSVNIEKFPETINNVNYLGSILNVRLDNFNKTLALTFQKPQPNINQSNCFRVICPPWISDNNYCWKCY